MLFSQFDASGENCNVNLLTAFPSVAITPCQLYFPEPKVPIGAYSHDVATISRFFLTVDPSFRLLPDPWLTYVSFKGAEVWDPEGRKYYDFLSAYSAVNQGPYITSSLLRVLRAPQHPDAFAIAQMVNKWRTFSGMLSKTNLNILLKF
jgi:hypothetical protein